MTAYVITYGKDPTDRLAAYAFPTRNEAWVASRKLTPSVPVDGWGRYDPTREARPNAGGCTYVIEKEEDVTFGGRLLVEVYNGLTGESVSRFESRAIGVKRLFTKLPTVAVGQLTRGDTMPDETAQTTEEVHGRRPKYPDNAVFKLTGENPWKAGKNNHARLTAALNATREPRTIKALVDAGLTRGDIAYLVDHNHATITNPE